MTQELALFLFTKYRPKTSVISGLYRTIQNQHRTKKKSGDGSGSEYTGVTVSDVCLGGAPCESSGGEGSSTLMMSQRVSEGELEHGWLV